MRLTWVRTVGSLTMSRSAISWLLSPWAINFYFKAYTCISEAARLIYDVQDADDAAIDVQGFALIWRRLT
jgi:hypothetical protein